MYLGLAAATSIGVWGSPPAPASIAIASLEIVPEQITLYLGRETEIASKGN